MGIEDTLKRYVREDDRTPSEIARLSGCHRGLLYKWMNGTRGLGTESIEKLVAFYKLELRPVETSIDVKPKRKTRG